MWPKKEEKSHKKGMIPGPASGLMEAVFAETRPVTNFLVRVAPGAGPPLAVLLCWPILGAAEALHLKTIWTQGVGNPPYADYPAIGGNFSPAAFDLCAPRNRPFAASLQAAGGTPPYTYYLGINTGTPGEYGPLPAWFDFDPATGQFEITIPDVSQHFLRIGVSDSADPPEAHPTGGFAQPHSGSATKPFVKTWDLPLQAPDSPSQAAAGSAFQFRNRAAISGCASFDLVLWTTLETELHEDFGQDESLLVQSIAEGGLYTDGGVLLPGPGIAIPPKSVYWNLGDMGGNFGIAFARTVHFLPPSGSLAGTRHVLTTHYYGRAAAPFSPSILGTRQTQVTVLASLAPAIHLQPLAGAVADGPAFFALPGADLVLEATAPPGASNNGSAGGAFETLYQALTWIEVQPLCDLLGLDSAACAARLATPGDGGSIEPAFDPLGQGPGLAVVWPLAPVSPGQTFSRQIVFSVPQDAEPAAPVNILARLDSARSAPVSAAVALGISDSTLAAASLDATGPATLDLNVTNIASFSIEVSNQGAVALLTPELVIGFGPANLLGGGQQYPELDNILLPLGASVDLSQASQGEIRVSFDEMAPSAARTVSISLSWPACASSQASPLSFEFRSATQNQGEVVVDETLELALSQINGPGASFTMTRSPTALFAPGTVNYNFSISSHPVSGVGEPLMTVQVPTLPINGMSRRPELVEILAAGATEIDSSSYAENGQILLLWPDLAGGEQRTATVRLGFPSGIPAVNYLPSAVFSGQACTTIQIERQVVTGVFYSEFMQTSLGTTNPTTVPSGGEFELDFRYRNNGEASQLRAHLVAKIPDLTAFVSAGLPDSGGSVLCSAPPLDHGMPSSLGLITVTLIDTHFEPGVLVGDRWHCPAGQDTTWVAWSLDDASLDFPSLIPGPHRDVHLRLRDESSANGSLISARVAILSSTLLSAQGPIHTIEIIEPEPPPPDRVDGCLLFHDRYQSPKVRPPQARCAKGQVNDTGLQQCQNIEGELVDCPIALLTGQDAEFGRDAKAGNSLLAKIGTGPAGFDYSKLDEHGQPLPAGAADWRCVRDNFAGLEWEIKRDDPTDLRHRGHRYSWLDRRNDHNGGEPGLADGGSCQGSPCDTESYVEAVNDQRLCGVSDWRLPTRAELASLVNSGRSQPALADELFGDLEADAYWSATPLAPDPTQAWTVEFDSGIVSTASKTLTLPVRLVREVK